MRLYLVVQALGCRTSTSGISGAFFVALAASLLTAVPLTPAGLGFVEGGIVGLLTIVYGVRETDALAITLVDRAISVLSIIVHRLDRLRGLAEARGLGVQASPRPRSAPAGRQHEPPEARRAARSAGNGARISTWDLGAAASRRPRATPHVGAPHRTATEPSSTGSAIKRMDMYERGIWADSGAIDHPGMTRTNGRAFNEWLRAQLKAKKMSQRQLAQQSGVDHSTISRLVRGDRMPSLGTATKLARGLRELGENDDGPQYLGLIGGGVQNPTARVEYALRADEALSEAQVRQVMEYYLAVRMRRVGTAFSDGSNHMQRSSRPSARLPPAPPRSTARSSRDRRSSRAAAAASRWRPARRSPLDSDRSARRTASDRIFQLTREWPPRSRSRGRRTPALGAPAFVIRSRPATLRGERSPAGGRVAQRAPRRRAAKAPASIASPTSHSTGRPSIAADRQRPGPVRAGAPDHEQRRRPAAG